jgi:hypothetical protein
MVTSKEVTPLLLERAIKEYTSNPQDQSVADMGDALLANDLSLLQIATSIMFNSLADRTAPPSYLCMLAVGIALGLKASNIINDVRQLGEMYEKP